MDNMLEYDEQVEWNRLQDLHIYIVNNLQIDNIEKQFINTLVKGCTEMITDTNKKQVMATINDLLTKTKELYERKCKTMYEPEFVE
ncbi:MAG: Clas6 [Betabaculovirus sp.]|nr:MAG: Clas6 [Betabaculovirus sp.]